MFRYSTHAYTIQRVRMLEQLGCELATLTPILVRFSTLLLLHFVFVLVQSLSCVLGSRCRIREVDGCFCWRLLPFVNIFNVQRDARKTFGSCSNLSLSSTNSCLIACGCATVQLDWPEEPCSALHGTLLAEIEAQRTIKRAEPWSFMMGVSCLTGPATVHTDNMGILLVCGEEKTVRKEHKRKMLIYGRSGNLLEECGGKKWARK